MSALREIVRDARAINLSTTDHTCSTSSDSLIFCATAGNVTYQFPSGITVTKAVIAGEYIRVWPKLIIRATTTATVQEHILW